MKLLRELDGHFIRIKPNGLSVERVETFGEANGVWLDCPCGTGHALAVPFKNCPVEAWDLTKWRWTATGTSLDDLTLDPSVNGGCWHGFIRNGTVITV